MELNMTDPNNRCVRIQRFMRKEKNEVDFMLVNFDYINGTDIIAKLLCKKFNMRAEEKLEGIWFSIIKVYDDSVEYDLIWHEDVGNYITCKRQDQQTLLQLETRLEQILKEINDEIKENNNQNFCFL